MLRVILPLALIVSLFSHGMTVGATIYVPDDYGTIQKAIIASVNGDVVIVRSGTYYENIDFIGRAITVKADEQGPVATIDGSGLGRVVSFRSGEGRDSALEGFTITNGKGPQGGGVWCYYSSPTIRGNVIANNSTESVHWSQGAGIYYCGGGLRTLRLSTTRSSAWNLRQRPEYNHRQLHREGEFERPDRRQR